MSTEPTFDPRRKAAIRDLVVTHAAATRRGTARKRTALIVALVLLAVSISGGTVAYALGTGLLAPAPVATETPSPTSTPTSTPTPTPTPTPTAVAISEDPADTSTWAIRFDGVGPVSLVTPFQAQHQTIPAFSDSTDPLCVSGMAALVSPDGLRFTFVGAADGSGQTAAIEFGNSGTGEDDRATTPKTPEGIGISSTADELLAAYPNIQKTGTYSDVTYYGLTDDQGDWIVFAVMHGEVFDIQIGNEAVLPVGQGTVKAMPSERCPA